MRVFHSQVCTPYYLTRRGTWGGVSSDACGWHDEAGLFQGRLVLVDEVSGRRGSEGGRRITVRTHGGKFGFCILFHRSFLLRCARVAPGSVSLRNRRSDVDEGLLIVGPLGDNDFSWLRTCEVRARLCGARCCVRVLLQPIVGIVGCGDAVVLTLRRVSSAVLSRHRTHS